MEKGSSSSSSSSGGGVDSLNGLNFGKKIYFEGVCPRLRPKIGCRLLPDDVAPPRSPAKKGRTAVVQRGQTPRCQVEGCKVDLSDAKAYYCRHKVCTVHSKSPKVIVAGIEQRFCQQCSRFHQLPEFDQGKRSCRRRLAGHNERRRKPPLGPLLSSRYASLSPFTYDNHSKKGGFVMDFSAYSTFPERNSCPNTSERGLANQTSITEKYQLPWQSSNQTPLPILLQSSTTRSSYSGPGVSSQDYFNGVPDSSSALSLLSNANDFIGTNGAAIVQPSMDPIAPVGQFSFPSWNFEGNQASSSLHWVPPDMGISQFFHPSNSLYSRDLSLARPNDRQYHEFELYGGNDPSVPHTNWSL